MNVIGTGEQGKTLRVGPIEMTFGRVQFEVRLPGGTSVLVEVNPYNGTWHFEVATEREDHLPEYPAVPALDRDPQEYPAEAACAAMAISGSVREQPGNGDGAASA